MADCTYFVLPEGSRHLAEAAQDFLQHFDGISEALQISEKEHRLFWEKLNNLIFLSARAFCIVPFAEGESDE